jgi:hypothetical protein
MVNPWEDFTRPVRGDSDINRLYEYLGRAISSWEHVEFELSRLYSLFSGTLDSDRLLRDYGKGRIFSERLLILRKAAHQWFAKSPSQNLEADFDEICAFAEGFAMRRNEVAHAVILPTDVLPFFLEGRSQVPPTVRRWAVIPPYYLGRKHHEPTNIPEFAYVTSQLRALMSDLIKLKKMIRAYRETL